MISEQAASIPQRHPAVDGRGETLPEELSGCPGCAVRGTRYLLKRGELLDRLDVLLGGRVAEELVELLDRLDVLLGGRVAEELVYGDVSTGAQDDLERAADMARRMVTQYGMSERLRQVTFDSPRTGSFFPEADCVGRA